MGTTNTRTSRFHYTSVERLVPADDPLRAIEAVIDWEVIREQLAPFYSETGRPSIPPEQLIKAMLIGYLFGITSERRLMREIQVNLSYRRFLGMDLEAEVWHPTTFTKNRNQRFKESRIIRWLFDHVVSGAVAQGLVTGHHLSRDGTLVWANCSFKRVEPIAVTQSPKQYRQREVKEDPAPPEAKVEHSKPTSPRATPNESGDRNPDVDFRGARRTNATHRSKTDPDARLARRGMDRKPSRATTCNYTMDNQSRFILEVETTRAEGSAEITAGLTMPTRLRRRHRLKPRTVGADRGYFVVRYLRSLRRRQIRPRTLKRVPEQPLFIALVQNLKRLVRLRQLALAG